MGNRGYLYAYDAERKKLLENYKSNENYVYASGGIFFLNKKCIFCVQAPAHENAEDPFYTLVDMYCIKDNKFRHRRTICTNGDMIIYSDTALISFYKNVIK